MTGWKVLLSLPGRVLPRQWDIIKFPGTVNAPALDTRVSHTTTCELATLNGFCQSASKHVCRQKMVYTCTSLRDPVRGSTVGDILVVFTRARSCVPGQTIYHRAKSRWPCRCLYCPPPTKTTSLGFITERLELYSRLSLQTALQQDLSYPTSASCTVLDTMQAATGQSKVV